MGKKLSEDEIKWILSVESSEAQQNIHKLTKENQKLAASNKALTKEMTELVAQGKKESQEYKNLDKALQSNNQQIGKNKKLIGALTDKLNINELTMAQLRKRAKELARQLENTSRATHLEEYARLNNQLKATNARIGQLNNSGKQIASMFSAANVARGVFVAGLATVTMSLRNSISMLKDFEKGTANLAAVLGTTRSQIKPLIDEAKRLGATTAFTASQVISLETELAKLGFTQLEIIQSTKSVLAFAGATGAELPNAAKLAGAALRMFGLDASQMDRVVSTLAVSTTKSALDFGYLENALSTVGPVAKTFGFTIEDTVALLGTLANSGFDASSAATATRNILLNLADSSGKLAKALGEPVKSFDELIPALSLLKSQGVDLATTLELTDKRSVAAFNSFLSGTDTVLTLRDSITDCGEALKAMQLEKLNTLSGSTALLSSSWEGLLLKFEGSNGILKSLVDFLTKIVDTISSLVDWSSKYTAYIKAGTVAVLTYIGVQKASLFLKRQHLIATGQVIASSKLENALLKTNTFLITAKNTLVGVLTGKIKVATAAQQMFNLVLKSSPLGLITSLAMAAGVAFLTFRKKSDEMTLSMKSLKNIQSKVIEEMGSQASKIKALSDIVHNGNLSYQERKRALDELQSIVPDYNASLTQEGKLINDNKGAMDAYLVSLEKQIKLKAAQEELEELYKKQRTKEKEISGFELNKKAAEDIPIVGTGQSGALAAMGKSGEIQAYQSKIDTAKKDLLEINKAIQDVNKEISFTAIKTPEREPVKTDLIEAKKKEIEVAEKEVASTKEEVEARNKKVAALKAELEVLQNLGVEKKKENNSAKSSINTDVAERDAIKSLEALREEDLQSQQKWYNTAKYAFDTDLKEKLITKEGHEILIAQLDNQSAQVRLQIEKNYLQDSQSLELTNGTLKEDIVRKSGQRVINAQKDVDDTRLKAEQTFQDNLDAMRKMIQQPELTPEEKLKAEYDINLGILESFYQASLEYARQNGQDETEVTETYEKAKTSLYKKYCKDKVDLANETASKLKGIAGNELSNNIADIFNMIQKLKLDMKEVPAEVGKDLLQLAALTSQALGSVFSSFKQMELDDIETRYNAEIEAAQGNSEEIERLEQEKAQKKLDVEKKYADVQFAVKASEIIANTALAIMTAYGQLGPIAGSIFAALMGATGALELAVANKERQKVKNMTLSGNKSSSGTRVATGRESGGKIDVTRSQDGKLFKNADYDPDGRGFIDKPTVIVGEGPIGKSKEWVASNAAVKNPTIAPFLNLLDQHQQAGDIATVDMNQIIRQRMAGFSSGGGISSPHGREESNLSSVGFTTSSVDNNDFFDKLTTLFELYLTEIKAYVVLSDIEAKQQLLDRSRSIGSK